MLSLLSIEVLAQEGSTFSKVSESGRIWDKGYWGEDAILNLYLHLATPQPFQP